MVMFWGFFSIFSQCYHGKKASILSLYKYLCFSVKKKNPQNIYTCCSSSTCCFPWWNVWCYLFGSKNCFFWKQNLHGFWWLRICTRFWIGKTFLHGNYLWIWKITATCISYYLMISAFMRKQCFNSHLSNKSLIHVP